jgi:SPP1 family predicted phage head-tail adaptor
MNPGQLNKRIDIYTVTFDDSTGFNEQIETPFSTVWASVEMVNGFINTEQENNTSRSRVSFTIRYKSLPTNLKVEFRGKKYLIDEVKEDFNNRFITLIGVLE